MYGSISPALIRKFPQADGALQGSAGHGIAEIREQILGVVSTVMWGEFNGAGMFVSKCWKIVCPFASWRELTVLFLKCCLLVSFQRRIWYAMILT